MKRTSLQNRALHKYFELVAEDLIRNGITVKKVLESGIDLMPTKDIVKEMWRSVQKAMFSKKSTKDLTTQEINQIIDVFNKHFGENYQIFRAFPSIETLEEYLTQLENENTSHKTTTGKIRRAL